MVKGQKGAGMLLSYANLLLNTCANIFLTPLLISYLADDGYSIYKVMHAFAGPLMMFNLGVSTIVARCVVQCRITGQAGKQKKQNTIALALIISIAMAALVAVVGFIMRGQIPAMYGGNYTAEQLRKAQDVFIVFVLSTVMHILTDVFTGCAVGNERYLFNSGLVTAKNLVRIALIVLVVKLDAGLLAIAAADLVVSVGLFIVAVYYAVGVLHEIPKFTYLDKVELLQIFSFAMAILMQAVVNQVNSNVDTILLGAMVAEKRVITMYSSALTIYSVYNSMISVVVSFFLPDATKLVAKKPTGEQLTAFVTKAGRLQATIATGIVVGFALLGRSFISLWIGPQYDQAYFVALLLMIPVTIPLVENAMIAILDATLKRIYRSVVLVAMTGVNVFASILMIPVWGFYGAAWGTVLSTVVGHIVLMNLYYVKVFELKVCRMFLDIFHGVLPASIVSGAICIPLLLILPENLVCFLIEAVVFVVAYLLFLLAFGWNEEEKRLAFAVLRRIKRAAIR